MWKTLIVESLSRIMVAPGVIFTSKFPPLAASNNVWNERSRLSEARFPRREFINIGKSPISTRSLRAAEQIPRPPVTTHRGPIPEPVHAQSRMRRAIVFRAPFPSEPLNKAKHTRHRRTGTSRRRRVSRKRYFYWIAKWEIEIFNIRFDINWLHTY